MSDPIPILDPSKAREPRGSCALGVMIKAPQAGAVKTRLVPPLEPCEAAALNICFLRDTAANIADVVSKKSADGIAVYTPVGAEALFKGLLPEGFMLLAQRGDTFGERLSHAAEDLLSIGYRSLCLIDSDSPTLPPGVLASAVDALERDGDRVVLGPADDGGYYLIGLKRPHRHLFTGIEWSTPRVLSQTIERAAETGLEVRLLPAWYDVDEAQSLGRLCYEIFSSSGYAAGRGDLKGYAAPHTRAYLGRLIERKGRELFGPSFAARMEVAD
ncbi:MAG TPA: TIGR04282 family arsenosugar biosynthesis glycosyltransferase [Blastocatellia bacterium]|nr:TIGR04282 family arsenosugar biosynthesis glycosyltransferase [Blastocatellia bacterium]